MKATSLEAYPVQEEGYLRMMELNGILQNANYWEVDLESVLGDILAVQDDSRSYGFLYHYSGCSFELAKLCEFANEQETKGKVMQARLHVYEDMPWDSLNNALKVHVRTTIGEDYLTLANTEFRTDKYDVYALVCGMSALRRLALNIKNHHFGKVGRPLIKNMGDKLGYSADKLIKKCIEESDVDLDLLREYLSGFLSPDNTENRIRQVRKTLNFGIEESRILGRELFHSFA